MVFPMTAPVVNPVVNGGSERFGAMGIQKYPIFHEGFGATKSFQDPHTSLVMTNNYGSWPFLEWIFPLNSSSGESESVVS